MPSFPPGARIPGAGVVAIVTGASRGLGHAVAARLLSAGARVLAISRRAADDLVAGPTGVLEQWTEDLADPVPVAGRLAAWLGELAPRQPVQVRLIHNAALLAEPGNVGEGDPADQARSVRVGLEAPVALTTAFLRATADWSFADRRVLFVSSGLGRRPMAGAATYCAQKAGLDHFARALALEEAARARGARVASVAPGIIDTDMQRQLRGADARRFSERAMFEEWHRTGALSSPDAAAERLLALLERDDYGSRPVADVRD